MDEMGNMRYSSLMARKTVTKTLARKEGRIPRGAPGVGITHSKRPPMQSWTVSAPVSISADELRAALEQRLGPKVRVEPALRTTVEIGTYNKVMLEGLRQKAIAREFETRRELLLDAEPVEGICNLLGVRSRQTIHNWIESGRVLALDDGNRKMLPVWQFDASMRDRLVPGFKKVLDALRRPPFSAALWFTNRNPRLGNRAPIDVLRAGDTGRVLKEASRAEQTP